MHLYKSNENKLSYKQPLIQLSAAAVGYILVLKRGLIFTWLGVSNQWMDTYGRVIDFLCFAVLAALALPFYIGIADFFEVFSIRKKLKKKQKKNKSKKATTGKQYTLAMLTKRLKDEDIIEIEIKTLYGFVVIGSSSDFEPGSFEGFDKRYYIKREELELEEFEPEQEKAFLEKVSHLCGGESITVLSIDGVKVR